MILRSSAGKKKLQLLALLIRVSLFVFWSCTQAGELILLYLSERMFKTAIRARLLVLHVNALEIKTLTLGFAITKTSLWSSVDF